MNTVIALVLFPGLLLTLVLGGAYHVLVENTHFGRLRLPAPSLESITAAVSVLLAALGVLLLPWPLHPRAGSPWVDRPFVLLLAFEGAFLLPLVPGLLARDPLANRATIREAQIGIAGRVVVWLALGTLLWGVGTWSPISLPGRLLIILAGLLALGAALGAGPFSADRALASDGAEHGLDAATAGLLRFARSTRNAALLLAFALAIVPRATVQPAVALLLIAAITLVVGIVLRRISGALPRMALPNTLRWCWWRALPLALVGLCYLALVAQ